MVSPGISLLFPLSLQLVSFTCNSATIIARLKG
nr:MAG TPA: hypothetical protein [Caudoviricetes sp.]